LNKSVKIDKIYAVTYVGQLCYVKAIKYHTTLLSLFALAHAQHFVSFSENHFTVSKQCHQTDADITWLVKVVQVVDVYGSTLCSIVFCLA